MSTVEEVRLAAEQMASTLAILDKLGASLTAAKLSSAMDCLRKEVRNLTDATDERQKIVELEETIEKIFG